MALKEGIINSLFGNEFSNLKDIGTHFPIGRTIVTASFASHKDPENQSPSIDFKAKANAIWLTSPLEIGGISYDFIIGTNGELSDIAIVWADGFAQVYMRVGESMQMITSNNKNYEVKFSNVPQGALTSFVSQGYVENNLGLREFYGVMQLPAETNLFDIESIKPYISKNKLVSGMKKRGLKNHFYTSLSAVRITDRTSIPFARSLRKN